MSNLKELQEEIRSYREVNERLLDLCERYHQELQDIRTEVYMIKHYMELLMDDELLTDDEEDLEEEDS